MAYNGTHVNKSTGCEDGVLTVSGAIQAEYSYVIMNIWFRVLVELMEDKCPREIGAMSLEITKFHIDMKNKINSSFNLEELQNLCFDLGVDYENLPGETKQIKTAQFVLYLARRAQLDDLFQEVKARRSDNKWPEIPSTSQQSGQLLQLARYSEPLLRAAFDLQSRFYNIVDGSFLKDFYLVFQEFATYSTLYNIAQYLCYVEIMRWEGELSDFGDTSENRDLLSIIQKVFATDKIDSHLMIFRAEQRAIGEIMISQQETKHGPNLRCIGYAEFVERMDEAAFNRWFTRLSDDVGTLATGPEEYYWRLILLQHLLIDLIDVLDPEKKRISKGHRGKLPVPKKLEQMVAKKGLDYIFSEG